MLEEAVLDESRSGDAVVFIIDDDPLATRNLAEALEREPGYEARAFTSTREALAASRDRGPEAVVVGLGGLGGLGGMPERGGLSLLDELRAADPELVAVVMTHGADRDGTARAIAAVGPLGHVHKPCTLSDLLPRLEAGLDRRRLVRALRDTRAQLASKGDALEESARQVERATAELRTTHTELATATERLVQAEQLAAVGRVVTGIAHELSRQLALVGYAEAIKSRVAHDPELVEFADIIVNAQKRLVTTVDEIRDFVSAETDDRPLDREPADLAAVVDEALALMRYDREVRARHIRRAYRCHPLCALHRTKFAQVVINLVSNAVLATEPGDEIEIAIDTDETSGQDHLAILTVDDRGVGMPGEVLARLGEPFFTTRGDRGSGLGVGICTRIVEEHGGELSFSSAVGRGTTARVALPLLAESGPVPAEVTP